MAQCSALPCTSPLPGHSRALHSSDAMALPPPHWQPLGREERGWLGGAGPDPPTAPRSHRVGSGRAHTCVRCACPCPCVSAPVPVSCWVIAFLKCQIHTTMLKKCLFALPGSQSSKGVGEKQKNLRAQLPRIPVGTGALLLPGHSSQGRSNPRSWEKLPWGCLRTAPTAWEKAPNQQIWK